MSNCKSRHLGTFSYYSFSFSFVPSLSGLGPDGGWKERNVPSPIRKNELLFLVARKSHGNSVEQPENTPLKLGVVALPATPAIRRSREDDLKVQPVLYLVRP